MRVCGGWKKRLSERPKGTAGYAPACCVGCACGSCRCISPAARPPRSIWRPITLTRRGRPATVPTAISLPASGRRRATANGNYVLPSNRNLAGVPPPASELERRRPYRLPELIDIAQSNNPATRNAWNDARNAALAAGIAESAFFPFVSAGIVQGWQTSHNEFPRLGPR